MIQATIDICDPQDAIDAFETVEKIPFLEVVKIENELQSPSQAITVNFVFRNKLVGEILMRCGQPPVNYASHKFLKDLLGAQSPERMRQRVLEHVDELAG